MTLENRKRQFEQTCTTAESVILTFEGAEGYDVYNCSVPFSYGGRQYIYGRVEKPEDWARSRAMLFVNTGPDRWTRVSNSMIYQIEDPNIAELYGQLVLGGVFVRYSRGEPKSYVNLFYRGTDLEDMFYFTTGPENMKDIRLVSLPDGRIGVFSRPRDTAVYEKLKSHAAVGFAVIDSLDALDEAVIEHAPYIPDIIGEEQWGGVNQAYLLDSGKIGLIGHLSYTASGAEKENAAFMAGVGNQVYMTTAMIFDPEAHAILEQKIIATRAMFPAHRAKKPHIEDCTFPSGIVMRADGRCDLYCGLGDCAEGRAVISYPFAGYGAIVTPGK